jgi:hypothetical protein
MSDTKPKIPKGWRRLRAGAVIKYGDRYFGPRRWWATKFGGDNRKVGWDKRYTTILIYIRRKRKGRK